MLPNFKCGNPYYHCDGIRRRGLQEQRNGEWYPYREKLKSDNFSLGLIKIQQESVPLSTKKGSFQVAGSACCLECEVSASETVTNKCSSCSANDIFVKAKTELTKTCLIYSGTISNNNSIKQSLENDSIW